MSPASPGRRGCRGLSLGLAYLLIFHSPAPVRAVPPQSAISLRIIVQEGEGAINDIRRRTAQEPIVQVQDENNRPVAGAVVVFTAPDRGASGMFANGQTAMNVLTNPQGRAVGTGLRPNSVQGDFQIRVDASYQGARASAIINQTNSHTAVTTGAGGRISRKTIALLLVIAGGGAAGGIAAATRGGRSAPTTPTGPAPTSVTAGTPAISPPR